MSIGELKVHALGRTIDRFTRTQIKAIDRLYNGEELHGLVISAVDAMDTRRFIWDEIKRQKDHINGYIDTRMGGELMKIYPVTNIPSQFYEETLHRRGELQLRCTERTIIYNVMVLAGLTACIVKKMIKQEQTPYEVIFDLKLLMAYTEA